MSKEDWKNVSVTYFPKSNSLHIKAKSTEFYPLYLKYYLQYLRLPEDATLKFTDKTIKGGVKEWLNQTKKEKN